MGSKEDEKTHLEEVSRLLVDVARLSEELEAAKALAAEELRGVQSARARPAAALARQLAVEREREHAARGGRLEAREGGSEVGVVGESEHHQLIEPGIPELTPPVDA